MSSRILVPMDGSPLSWKALNVALEENPGADIVVLHVIDPAEPGYSYYPNDIDIDAEPLHGSEEWYELAQERADELFEEVQERVSDYDVGLTTELAISRPSREIVDYAAKNDIDQIFIGSHGREEDSPLLLGSVTEAVVFRSPVRVTLIR